MHWLFVAVVVNLVIAAAPAAAQAQHSPRFAHLSVEDGLSQSSVEHILQDRDGLMWFGTQEGLNRYDGYRFTVHRAREQDGFLRDHAITALVEGPIGDLWVGTSRGLYRYHHQTGRFEGFASPVDQLDIGIGDVIVTGTFVYFASTDGRVWAIDRLDTARGARLLSENAFAPLRGATALTAGDGSTIWIASGGRLFNVDPPSGRLTEALADLGSVSVLKRDQQGHLWIGRTAGELLRYRPAERAVDRFPQVPPFVLAIMAARSGEIWIGARRNGVSRLDPATGAIATYRHDPDEPASLTADDVAAIYEDAAGSVWIGTWNGGIDRFDPDAQAFRTLRPRLRSPESLPTGDVTAIAESEDGTLWLASRSGLLMRGDPRADRFRTVANLPPKGGVFGIALWDGHIFLGMGGGLAIFDPASGREVALAAGLQHHRLGERRIQNIRADADGVWMVSGKDLFRIVRPGSWRVEQYVLPIAGSAWALSVIENGRIWIGTDSADVLRAEWKGSGGATVTPLALDQSTRDALLSRRPISSLHADGRGQLWIGTRRGLGQMQLASRAIAWLGEAEGLPSTDVSGITADADGALWISHNSGLTRIDPSTQAMRHFGEREGAQGKGYAEGAWATGASGRMYFAGQGITMFDPRDARISASRPRVVFTALEILHKPVMPDWLDPQSPLQRTIGAQQAITLEPGASVFSVEMAALHYLDPPNNRLMYRLEGFDPEWIETSATNRVVTYTNLAPGRYVLHARAGTKNGVWSERDATLAITILPPWWRTRTAMAAWALLAIGAAALVWAGVRRRARVRMALLERETLRRESLTDPLTGLRNRRFLMSHLQHEVPAVLREYRGRGAAAAETGDDLLLLLVDVDHFKSINDQHSHATGDRVLTRIAATLHEHIRDSDIAVRWGGDEFLIVTRSFRRASAADYAERLRAAVEAVGHTLAADGGPACTVSIGFAAFPFVPSEPEALSWEKTLDLADHALRQTKARRRNSYTGLVAREHVDTAAVSEFLACSDVPLPVGVEMVTPRE